MNECIFIFISRSRLYDAVVVILNILLCVGGVSHVMARVFIYFYAVRLFHYLKTTTYVAIVSIFN